MRALCHESTPETVIFVDVGAGLGHQYALLKNTFPDLKGRVILQEQPVVLEHATKVPGVAKTAFDFWRLNL